MFIVFDSNIWFSEMGLNSTKGAAARFFINQRALRLHCPKSLSLKPNIILKI